MTDLSLLLVLFFCFFECDLSLGCQYRFDPSSTQIVCIRDRVNEIFLSERKEIGVKPDRVNFPAKHNLL